ncbi:pilus assembly protein TadG-related protein [Pontibacterium sp.]|uniref:type IV pilus modification PilV family protein n=1 Tax=Pontibacterium sp. TaxID=2036026 RepID=UPI003515F705
MDRPYSTRMVSPRSFKRQRGVVMVILTIGMLAILAMSGLALDSGHILLTKTRLQNAVDAAALSAAEVLSTTGSTANATAEANAAFTSNLDAPGNSQLADAWADGAGEITLNVEFSTVVSPFTPSGNPPYVRVTATGFTLDSWLVQVVGITETEVVASAVSGPSAGLTGICNVAPILACGCRPGIDPGCCDPTGPAGCSGDDYMEDSFNPVLPAAGTLDVDDITGLSQPAGVGSDVGPGNYQMLRMDGAKGASDLRNALAGNSDYCVDTNADGEDWVDTEPGNMAGPVSTGLNARFDGSNKFDVPADYLTEEFLEDEGDELIIVEDPDGLNVVTTASGLDPSGSVFDYAQYASEIGSAVCGASGGIECQQWRRMMVLPIGNCDGSINGTSSPVEVHAYGCFMLLQRVEHTGKRAVFGQFVPNPGGNSIPGCDATGGIDPDLPEYAPTKIVLYRNSDSGDS